MIASEKQVSSDERKQKIRDRYKGVDPSELEVIPVIATDEVRLEERPLRVAAYVRVSTENDEQVSSFELQCNEFTERIQANPKWEFAGIYSDEGISGTEMSHRKGMLQMLEDARAGKIDHILAKSIARFARNVVDCLSVIEELRNLNPPVGVYFDESNLYTLDSTGALVLTILATVAEEESRSKSFIMNWSIERRFSRGLFLIPKLLGYDLDEDGNLVINPEEAETVKVIYDLYINGWTQSEIAEILTAYGRKTKIENDVWNPGSIGGILENERHCGDIRARKTYTPNFKTHKAKKNRQNRKQYIQRNHHEPIVSRDVYNAANLLKSSRAYNQKNRPLPVLSVIDQGILKGYVPVDRNWSGFSLEDYKEACRHGGDLDEQVPKPRKKGKNLNMSGYQEVRSQFFPSVSTPSMTITKGRLRFNTACLKKFQDVEYVELLINTMNNCIAIRPCKKENPNAIHWGHLRDERWVVSTLGCKGLAKTLFGLMNWEHADKYKFSGQFISKGDDKLLLFQLDEPVMVKTIQQVIVPETPDETDENGIVEGEDIVMTEMVQICPPSWRTSFGQPVESIGWVSVFRQKHYAGDWDILRPATELKEMNILTAEDLAVLMKEAETIMEGWELKDAG